MTKVADNQTFPNIALQDPRQRHQKLGVMLVVVVEIKDRSSFKFINQHLTR